MTIRTSGGKLLTKDGKLSCDCCSGGWYCYKQCDSCKTGAIPAFIRTSITYTMGDGTTTFAMRLRRMQTAAQVTQGVCPTYIGRSNAWPIREDGDPTLGPSITYTVDGGVRVTRNINIALAVSFTDLCAAGNAVRIDAGDNINFGFGWMLTPGGSVTVDSAAPGIVGNTFTGPAFVSTASGLCYGDYPGSGPIPIQSRDGGPKTYRGTLSLAVTGVE
jgi:hypothetical protein